MTNAVAQDRSEANRSAKPNVEFTPSALTEVEIQFLNYGNQSAAGAASVRFEYPKYSSNIFEPIDSGQAGALSAGPIRLLITVKPNLPANSSFSDLAANAVFRKSEVIAELANNPSASVIQNYEGLPVLLIEIDGSTAQSLSSINAIGAVELDLTMRSNHTSTIPIIDARNLQLHSTTGAGFDGGGGDWSVAVLDNGVRTSHVAFSGRLKSEACFVSDFSCPNFQNTMIGPGAASDCGLGGGRCSHGTHVSGTAVGEFTNSGLLSTDGVAPGAGLHAIQVFDATGDLTFFSDVLNGLNHVNNLVLAGERIASVNMSLGSFTSFSGNCDFASPATVVTATLLRNNGVLVVASAGNSFTSFGMGLPACLTPVVAIGNTFDNDTVSTSSSASSELELWAPGTSVISASDASNTGLANFTGTSMSAPHVAGAAAMLRECYVQPGSSAASPDIDDAILNALSITGVTVTDSRVVGGVTRPRIDVGAAARFIRSNDRFNLATSIGQPSGSFLGLNTCSTAEISEPNHLSGAQTTGSVWYDYQATTSGLFTFSTCNSRTSFDTVLTAYSGNLISNLSLVAVNDDTACAINSRASSISVPLTAGQSVKIAVSGFGFPNENGSTGVFDLRWTSTQATCNGSQATILGTQSNDTITGTNGDDVIVSFGGNDTINGLGGNDTICSGAGADNVLGGAGNDWIDVGDGADTVKGQLGDDQIFGGNGDDVLRGSRGNDVVNGGAGNDDINGGWGNDQLIGGPDNDTMFGDIGNDVMRGSRGNDTMDGGDGNDNLDGGWGNDSIKGGPNNDILRGNIGNDTIRGSRGDDYLDGGAGDDVINGGVHNVRDRCVIDSADTAASVGCEVAI